MAVKHSISQPCQRFQVLQKKTQHERYDTIMPTVVAAYAVPFYIKAIYITYIHTYEYASYLVEHCVNMPMTTTFDMHIIAP